MAIDWSFLRDPRIVSSLIGAGGSVLEGLGERSDRREDREFTAAERAKDRQQRQQEVIANFLAGQLGNERADLIAEGEQDRMGGAAAINALGGSPFAVASDLQKQRMRRALLENVGNVSIQAPADIEASRGKVSGGLRIPEGGFDTRALSEASLGENARAYLTHLAQVNPRGTTLDVGAMGLDPGITERVEEARAGYQSAEDARRQELREINRRREEQILKVLTGAPPAGPTGAPITENGAPLDAMNDQMRAQPWWQQFMAQQGFQPGQAIRLSDDQRKALRRIAEANGIQFGRGMEIDPAGNVNQDQGVSRYARTAANIALTAAPFAANFIPGVGPAVSAAIAGASGAGRAALNGGSARDALVQGALGAGMSYGMSQVPNPFRIPRTPQTQAPTNQQLIDQYLRFGPTLELRN